MTFTDDIPRDLAVSAHSGTSFSPEKRADTVQADYDRTTVAAREKLITAAGPGRMEEALDKFERWRAYHRRLFTAWLHSRSGIVSTMIAGGSNFPVARMAKKNRAEHAHSERLCTLPGKLLSRMLRDFRPGPVRIGDRGAAAEAETHLAELEAKRDRMRAVNAAHRAFVKNPASLDAATLSDADKAAVRSYVPRYSWEQHPFAPFELTNLSANIRRVRDNLERARAADARRAEAQVTGDKEETVAGVRILHNTGDNRLQLFFPGKPDAATRDKLKGRGFRWSPTAGAWQRQLTAAAEYAAKEILES